MVRSSADRVLIGISDAESSYGTAPTGAYDKLRFNSDSLSANAEFTRSDEITGNLTTKALVLSQRGAGGDLTCDLYHGSDVGVSLKASDKMWVNLLQATGGMAANAWTSDSVTTTTGVDANASGNTFTKTGLDASYANGDWLAASGGSPSANNGIYIQTAEATDTLTVAGGVLQDDAGAIVLQDFSLLSNGTALETFTVEKNFADQTTDDFHLFRGCAVSGVRVQGQVGGIASQTFSLVGAGQETGDIGDTTTSSGAYDAASTADPFNVVDHLGVAMDGEANSGILTPGSFEINLQRNLRPQFVMGSATAVGMGNGSLTITGSYTQHFEDATELDKFLANTASSLAFGFWNTTALQGLLLFLPAIRYVGNPTVVAEGRDSDIIVSLPFEAYEDPSNAGVMVYVGKTS